MCTVTWLHESGGYQLFCNRDERFSRKSALAPVVSRRDGVLFTAPLDGEFNGTWLATNEYGITVCLLNGVGVPSPGARSRGLLVLELLPSQSREEVARRLHAADRSGLAPFAVAVLAPDEPALVAGWDGSSYSENWSADSTIPLTSSSYDTDAVIAARHGEFRRRLNRSSRIDTALLASFHVSHSPEPSAYSACMHREDAATVSFTRVSVRPEEVEMVYHPEAPCRRAVAKTSQLARVR